MYAMQTYARLWTESCIFLSGGEWGQGSGFMLAHLSLSPLASFPGAVYPPAGREYRIISPLLPWHMLFLLFRIPYFGGGVCYKSNVSPKIHMMKL